MKEALTSSETSVLTEPQGVTSQKTPFFIVTVVKTSNLTKLMFTDNLLQKGVMFHNSVGLRLSRNMHFPD
jgi:hypothetical protein